MSLGSTRRRVAPPTVRRHGNQSRRRRTRRIVGATTVFVVLFALGATAVVRLSSGSSVQPQAVLPASPTPVSPTSATPAPVASMPPVPFNPSIGAVLPTHRVVAFYGVPGAAATGPAYTLSSSMLARLRAQGAAYQKLDPAHPVDLGIDLVADVPDHSKGASGTYSHYVSDATIKSYVAFCEKNHLLLFLDLNIGWADPLTVLDHFDNYLKLPFVNVAIDPEWMFPLHNGVPGVNLSNVRASDLNPVIEAVAAMPMEYHVPRKILIIHQYRGDGDGKANPYAPGQSEIADKRDIVNDTRVDVVIHIDSVGGFVGDIADKVGQYTKWVTDDMAKYGNFRYGGFKIFYQLESKPKLMTPAQVMAMKPAPMVITYGN